MYLDFMIKNLIRNSLLTATAQAPSVNGTL